MEMLTKLIGLRAGLLALFHSNVGDDVIDALDRAYDVIDGNIRRAAFELVSAYQMHSHETSFGEGYLHWVVIPFPLTPPEVSAVIGVLGWRDRPVEETPTGAYTSKVEVRHTERSTIFKVEGSLNI